MKEAPTPFVFKHGRRYLREASGYPLPVDLPELNRQVLRTMLLMQVFGAPFCCKLNAPPKRILEVACGSAFWSACCHEYLQKQGHDNVSFTGIDLAPLAPDLKKQGVNWKFIQHDLRKPSMPLAEGEFDLIFVNDSMPIFAANPQSPVNSFSDFKKYLKPGGVVEIWETDYVFRCLLPEPLKAPGVAEEDVEQANRTATYTISAATPFTKVQNKYLQNYNSWLESGFQKLGLSVAPCAVLGYGLSTEAAEAPDKVGCRRIAIPFSHFRWETEDGSNKAAFRARSWGGKGKSPANAASADRVGVTSLTADQAALRQTALNVTIGLIESLEPLLKEHSGMKQDEWYRWWGGMTTDLLEKEGTANGESLESGAWWVER